MMLLLQSGFPKSGNYWLYKILHNMLQKSGIQIKSYARSHPIYETARTWPYFEDQAGIDYLEINSAGLAFRKGSFTEPIQDIEAYLARCTHVWTHAYWQPEYAHLFGAFDHIVYIIRDPRDVAVSASRYFFTPFMQQQHPSTAGTPEAYLQAHLSEVLLSWAQHVGGYLLTQHRYNIYPIFYERLLADLPGELERLDRYLDTSLGKGDLAAIQQQVTFAAMKDNSPHHVRKGQANQWRQVLDADQVNQADKIAGEMMQLLGYDRAADVDSVGLPALPDPLDPQAVQSAVAASRGSLTAQAALAWQFLSSDRPLKEKLQKGLDFVFSRGRWKSAG
jgi:aryl sulfotransferase